MMSSSMALMSLFVIATPAYNTKVNDKEIRTSAITARRRRTERVGRCALLAEKTIGLSTVVPNTDVSPALEARSAIHWRELSL